MTKRDEEIMRLAGIGMSYGQISKTLEITRAAVSGAVFRERQRIAKAIGVVQPTQKGAERRRAAPVDETVPALERLPSFKLPADHVPVQLMEIRAGQCHFPIEGGYCGLVTDGTYCTGHRRAMYQPGGPKKVNAWVPR